MKRKVGCFGAGLQHLPHKGFSKACVSLFWVICLKSLVFVHLFLAGCQGEQRRKRKWGELQNVRQSVTENISSPIFQTSIKIGREIVRGSPEHCVVVYPEQSKIAQLFLFSLGPERPFPPPPLFHALFKICRSHSGKVSATPLNRKIRLRCKSLPLVRLQFWVDMDFSFLSGKIPHSFHSLAMASGVTTTVGTSQEDPPTQVILSFTFSPSEDTHQPQPLQVREATSQV